MFKCCDDQAFCKANRFVEIRRSLLKKITREPLCILCAQIYCPQIFTANQCDLSTDYAAFHCLRRTASPRCSAQWIASRAARVPRVYHYFRCLDWRIHSNTDLQCHFYSGKCFFVHFGFSLTEHFVLLIFQWYHRDILLCDHMQVMRSSCLFLFIGQCPLGDTFRQNPLETLPLENVLSVWIADSRQVHWTDLSHWPHVVRKLVPLKPPFPFHVFQFSTPLFTHPLKRKHALHVLLVACL